MKGSRAKTTRYSSTTSRLRATSSGSLGMAFCFKHLSLSGEIKGVYREEHLEVPVKAIREALINALVHRLYVRRGSSVSLAIYDDRIEIINPGAFPPSLTIEELRAGNKSEPRNPIIARVMYVRKALEAWGRGIKLILEECAKVKLPEPQIVSEGGYTKTVFMRPNGGIGTNQKAAPRPGLKTGQKEHGTDLDRDLDDLDQKIVALIMQNNHATYDSLSQDCRCSVPTTQRRLRVLQQKRVLRRVGPDRGGHWEVERE